MSVPFILPIIIKDENTDSKRLVLSGLVYAIPGIIISVIASALFAVTSLVSLLYIPVISLIGLITFGLAHGHIDQKKVVFLKTAIILLVFMLCLTV